jgi:hypothetical protein
VQSSSKLEALPQRYTFGRASMWRARIAAALGDRDGAVGLVRQALGEGQVYQDVHIIAEFANLRGYSPFDDLMRPKG